MSRDWNSKHFAARPGARRLAPVAALAAVLSASGCCPDAASVDLQPSWKVGDTARYEWNKSIRRSRAGAVAAETERRKQIELEVISADAGGHVFRIRRTANPPDAAAKPAEPPAKPLDPPPPAGAEADADRFDEADWFDEADGIDVLVETDRFGHLWRIKNFGDVRREVFERRAALEKKAEIAAPGDDKAKPVAKKPPSRSLDGAKFEQAIFSDANTWLNVLGNTYKYADSYTIERQVPDPFGDQPCPVLDTYTLESAAEESGAAVVYFFRTNDPEELTDTGRKKLDEQASKEGRSVPVTGRTLFASGTLRVDPATGLLQSLSLKTTKTAGDRITEESVEIKRIP
jgi:hypothetical protein